MGPDRDPLLLSSASTPTRGFWKPPCVEERERTLRSGLGLNSSSVLCALRTFLGLSEPETPQLDAWHVIWSIDWCHSEWSLSTFHLLSLTSHPSLFFYLLREMKLSGANSIASQHCPPSYYVLTQSSWLMGFFFISHCSPVKSICLWQRQKGRLQGLSNLLKPAQKVVVLEFPPRAVCFQDVGFSYYILSL